MDGTTAAGTKWGTQLWVENKFIDSLRRFAELTAAAFVQKDIPVYLYSDLCPTPFVPFAVSLFGCAAGVMVTASHNPKDDNGYKVYWENSAQVTYSFFKIHGHLLVQRFVHWKIKNMNCR